MKPLPVSLLITAGRFQARRDPSLASTNDERMLSPPSDASKNRGENPKGGFRRHSAAVRGGAAEGVA